MSLSPLLGLVVPGEGPVALALSKAQELCLQMSEYRSASERLLSRLKNLLAELQRMEREDQLPPANFLESYAALVTRYLRFLQLNRSKPLIYRVVKNAAMTEELQQLNEKVADLLAKLLDVDIVSWETQWRADRFVQDAVLAATLNDTSLCFHDLQSPRAQLEALLTLKFEAEKKSFRHEEEDLTRMRTLVGKIESVSRRTDVSLPSWFIPDYEVELQSKPFARGCLGSVHYGAWGKESKVVVKQLCVDESRMDESMWLQIEKDMDKVFQLEHPNIVELCGASHVGSPPILVYKNAVNGNLRSFLARSESNKRQMWRLMLEAATALQYLHEQGLLVHGNLKLSNILVDGNDRAVLSDFGLGTFKMCSGSSASGGSVRWRAPECMTRPPTAASDVFSLAMCIIEASTGVPPFSFLSEENVSDNARRGVIPDKPDDMTAEEWGLVLLMTTADPSKRVKLDYVVEKLKAFADPDQGSTREAVGACSSCCAAISPGSRFCSQCGVPFKSPTQTACSLDSPFKLCTSPEFLPESSVLFLLRVIQIGSVDDQEQAVMALFYTCLSNFRLQFVYDSSGISILIELVKRGRTHFLRACALGILSWAEIDLKLPTKDLEWLREWVGAATLEECNAIAASVRCISRQSKIKSLIHCACVSEGANTEKMDVLQSTGVIAPLITLLRNGDQTQTLLSICALGRLAAGVRSCEIMAQSGVIDALLGLLRAGTNTQKEHSAWALSRLTVSRDCCAELVEKGVIPLLVPLLQAHSSAARFHCSCVLGSLAMINVENRSAIIAHGAAIHFVELLQTGNDRLKTRVVCTLANLTVDKTNRGLLVRADVIKAFVTLLQDGANYHKGQAARALANLALDESHIDAIAQAGAIPFIVSLLRSHSRNEAARALANLSFKPESRHIIMDEGAIRPLVEMLRGTRDNMSELAARALANLALDADCRRAIADLGASDLLVRQLDFGSTTTKEYHLVRALANLASGKDNHKEILQAGAIPHFVADLKGDVVNLKTQAALAFANLTTSAESRSTIAKADAVVPLVALLREGTSTQKDHALRALANIAIDECSAGMIKEAGAIPLFTELLRNGSNKQKDHTVRALGSMAAMGGEITRSGAIGPQVELLRYGTHSQKFYAACALAASALSDEGRSTVVAEGAVDDLVALVRDGSDHQKIGAAQALNNLVAESNVVEVVKTAGVIPDLVALVGARNEKLNDSLARTLERVCGESGSCSSIISTGAISLLAGLLRSGTSEQKEDAVRRLNHLTSDENASHDFAEVIPELVKLLDSRTEAVKKDAVSTLANLASTDVNCAKIASGGGISRLVGILHNGTDDMQSDAAHALENLALNNQANRSEMNDLGVDSLLRELRRAGEPTQSDSASRALERMDECAPAPLKRMRCDT